MNTVFDSFDTALDALQANATERAARARRWHAAGGKVVGYLGNTVPLELIHAAGIMPYHLHGAPDEATPLADEFMEPAFDPWTRSIFNQLLRGDFDLLDAIVLPRSNDSQQRLYYYLCEIKRRHRRFQLPPVYLVNVLHSPRDSTTRHNEARLREFTEFLGAIGAPADDEHIQSSIGLYNRIRQQLSRFNERRAQGLSAINSVLAYQVYAAAQSLPPEESLDLLSALCQHMPDRLCDADTPRLVVAGNGVDHATLHQLADEAGITVSGDYHSLGNHFLGPALVADNTNPTAALATHYQYNSPCTRTFNSQPQDVVRFAEQQAAGAVLFHYLQKEEALSWHYPKQQRAAQAAGLRTALLIDQPYELDAAALGETLQALKQ